MAAKRICSVESCDKPVRCVGLCSMHYQRVRSHGDARRGKPAKAANGSVQRWIEANKGHTGQDCLIWPFSRDKKTGYAAKGAYRLMCIAAHGDPPSEQHQAAHGCGNGHLGCINPKHLRWATPKENQADRLVHGTHHRGARVNGARLTEADVLEIRSLRGKVTQREIAEMFGVNQTTVCDIHIGRSWSWFE